MASTNCRAGSTLEDKLFELKGLRFNIGNLEDLIFSLKEKNSSVEIKNTIGGSALGDYSVKSEDKKAELATLLNKWLEELKTRYDEILNSDEESDSADKIISHISNRYDKN